VSSSEIPPSSAPAAADVVDPAGPAATGPATGGAPEPAASRDQDPVCARIAEQLSALDTAGELPLAGHAQLYQHLHVELQNALADIDGA
jgi:hypothetical protein